MIIIFHDPGSKYSPERIRPSMFQPSEHSQTHNSQILAQPPPILARKLCEQHVTRICHDVRQKQRMPDVAINKQKKGVMRSEVSRKGEGESGGGRTRVCVFAMRLGDRGDGV
jgi:hypothetical protein